ncbi:MAG: N-acetylmuramoyl-L-alanine amidase [Verrucomicrobiota bacterium]|jgi:N-acetylmuramoyl-L-alanine amidase
MLQTQSTSGERIRGFFAWVGLLLMITSFAWLQLAPRNELSTALPQPKPEGPFALVIIDPGHGGQDSGAMCGGTLEKDLTFDVAQRLERLVQAQGLSVILTRHGDEYVSLADRVAIANRAHSCIFVSIHFNDTKKTAASGVETYYAARQETSAPMVASWLPFVQRAALELPNAESQSLADFVQQSLVGRTQAINRGTKTEQFYVLANVRHPAILVEGGFLTNKDDMNKLAVDTYREQIAAAIADGIAHYRDVVSHLQPVAPAPPPES